MGKSKLVDHLPIREGVERATYWRNPTPAELRMGYGATHYRDFPVAVCCHTGTRIPKRWFIAPDDGLRYYR